MAFTVVFDCSTGNRFASRTAVVGGGKEEDDDDDDDDDETPCSTLASSDLFDEIVRNVNFFLLCFVLCPRS